MKKVVLQKLEQLAKILTARKMDAHLFVHKDFEFFSEDHPLYHLNHQRIDLEWEVKDCPYEELTDVKLSPKEKVEKFSISLLCVPLDMSIEFQSNQSSNLSIVFAYFYTDDTLGLDLAKRLGFPEKEVEFSEKDLMNYLNEMIAFHSKFI
jgi:hypothetical protein